MTSSCCCPPPLSCKCTTTGSDKCNCSSSSNTTTSCCCSAITHHTCPKPCSFVWSLDGLNASTKHLVHLVQYGRSCGHTTGTVAYLFNTDRMGHLEIRISLDAHPDTRCKITVMTVVNERNKLHGHAVIATRYID